MYIDMDDDLPSNAPNRPTEATPEGRHVIEAAHRRLKMAKEWEMSISAMLKSVEVEVLEAEANLRSVEKQWDVIQTTTTTTTTEKETSKRPKHTVASLHNHRLWMLSVTQFVQHHKRWQ